MTLTLMTKMTYYQLNTYKHPPNTHFANVKYLYHKQTFKNWCSPVIKVIKDFQRKLKGNE